MNSKKSNKNIPSDVLNFARKVQTIYATLRHTFVTPSSKFFTLHNFSILPWQYFINIFRINFKDGLIL